MRIALTLGLMGLALAASPAASVNLIANGEFDANVAGWGTVEPVSVAWDPLDVDLSPSSGSLELETNPPPPTTDFHGADSECVTVAQGDELEISAWTFIPSAQAAALPQAAIGLKRFATPGCHPGDGFTVEAGPITDQLDQWTELAFGTEIQPGVVAVQVYLQGRNAQSGNQGLSRAYFDAVALPEPGAASGRIAALSALAALAARRRARGRPPGR